MAGSVHSREVIAKKRSPATSRGKRLADLIWHVAPDNGPLAEILRERADRILAKDGGRLCERLFTDAEIDLPLELDGTYRARVQRNG